MSPYTSLSPILTNKITNSLKLVVWLIYFLMVVAMDTHNTIVQSSSEKIYALVEATPILELLQPYNNRLFVE